MIRRKSHKKNFTYRFLILVLDCTHELLYIYGLDPVTIFDISFDTKPESIVSVVIKNIKMSFHCHELLNAFENRNLGKFAELLEVYEADPNFYVKSKSRTIFELILSTPNSSSFIRKCIEYGADFFVVNFFNFNFN